MSYSIQNPSNSSDTNPKKNPYSRYALILFCISLFLPAYVLQKGGIIDSNILYFGKMESLRAYIQYGQHLGGIFGLSALLTGRMPLIPFYGRFFSGALHRKIVPWFANILRIKLRTKNKKRVKLHPRWNYICVILILIPLFFGFQKYNPMGGPSDITYYTVGVGYFFWLGSFILLLLQQRKISHEIGKEGDNTLNSN